MTVSELIEELNYLNQDAEVRLACQPRWAFEYSIASVVGVTLDGDEEVVYLGEGSQLGYLPGEASEELGWS